MLERPTRKLDTLQRIELAEGVEIQLRLAGPTVRGLAWLLDFAIKSACFTILLILTAILTAGFSMIGDDKTASGMAMGILLLGMCLLDWIYSVAFEASPRGATPGKQAFGLKVRQPSGAPITLSQAVVRNLIRIIDLLPFGGTVGLISCLLTRRFQRLGDLAADTVVIHAETAPPGLSRAASLEGIPPHRPPVPLTREEQLAVMEFAHRYEAWPADRQRELAHHAAPLTRVAQERAVLRLLGLARWIRTEG